MSKTKDNHFQTIVEILVRRGLATSLEEASAIVRAGTISVSPNQRDYEVMRDPNAMFRFNEPIKITGSVLTFDPSKKPARPAAKSHCSHSAVEYSGVDSSTAESGAESSRSMTADSKSIGQVDLEELICLRHLIAKLEARLAVALSKGALIEGGVHTAELVPAHAENGHVHLDLVVW